MTGLDEIRQRVSLVALAAEAGAQLDDAHHLRSHCPLPRHAGDRSSLAFTIYDNGQKWKCHSSCPDDANGGDVISFYMAWKGVDFKTAVKELSERIGSHSNLLRHSSIPEPLVPPQSALWHERAEEFVSLAEGNLTDEARSYLHKERGLSDATIRAFHLGYNPTNLYDDPKRWGLEGRKIWLPRGIVIPGFGSDGKVSYIKIRRPLLGDALGAYIPEWNPKDGFPETKFGGPRGGRSVLFHLQLMDHLPVLILTEGEWDTLLLWEHCADLCDVGTIGGARSKFVSPDLASLTRYLATLVIHDDDKAGDEGRNYISKLHAVSQRIVALEPPDHDLTDYWKSGGDLRRWIAQNVHTAMVPALNQARESTPMRWRKVFFHIKTELALSER